MSEEIHDRLNGYPGVGRGYGDVPLETKAQAVTEISYGIDK